MIKKKDRKNTLSKQLNNDAKNSNMVNTKGMPTEHVEYSRQFKYARARCLSVGVPFFGR